jgi:hypothetical protein
VIEGGCVRILRAERVGTELRLEVHLDESRLVPEQIAPLSADRALGVERAGESGIGVVAETSVSLVPDPAYVERLVWGTEPPAGMSEAVYLETIRRETKLLAQARLAERQEASEPVAELVASDW